MSSTSAQSCCAGRSILPSGPYVSSRAGCLNARCGWDVGLRDSWNFWLRDEALIIDIHGHTTAPGELYGYNYQIMANRGEFGRGNPRMSDERIEAAMKGHLEQLAKVGTDMQFIAPRPWGLPNAGGDEKTLQWMAQAANDLIARQVELHPTVLRGIAGLPQVAGVSPRNCLEELERCAKELGFVGCMINPDPGEGDGKTPGMGDEFWYPLYEKMVELDMPGLVHTGACQSPRETQSEHFITEESIAALSLLRSRVFQDFPSLKLVIAHGGGSVPYQVGRYRAGRFGELRRGAETERFDESLRRLYFDTVLYSQESVELLLKVAGVDRCLFGTDRPGTGSVVDPDGGRELDDIRTTIEQIPWLAEEQRQRIFEGNTREAYSRFHDPEQSVPNRPTSIEPI